MKKIPRVVDLLDVDMSKVTSRTVMVIMVIVLVVKATILCFGVLLPPLVQLLTSR